jgi:ribosomal-protein-alanine N-acetyltransferase
VAIAGFSWLQPFFSRKTFYLSGKYAVRWLRKKPLATKRYVKAFENPANMKQIIETDRLILRELNIGDAKSFYELNLNPNVVKYTGDKAFANISEAQNFLKNYEDYETNGFGRWAVIDKSNGEFLGWCGLKYVKEINETDIGFRFFEEYWNKGFATESAKVCLNYGFEKLNLQTIIGRAMAENLASIKVLEKLGLTYEKEFNFDEHKGLIYRIKKVKPSHNSG